MSRFDSMPQHLIADQTTQGRHVGPRIRRRWRKVVVVYTLLVCMLLFFAYSRFRAHGGDAFSAVVRSLQGESGRGWSTLSYSVWEETIASSEGEYTRMNLLLVYGEMPSESAYPPPDSPDFYHRYRTTVEQSSSVLYVDVETHLAESDFDLLHHGLVERIVDQFKTPPRVSLVEALRTRVELLPYVVHNIILSFWDFLSIRDACTIAAILGGPGLPILALLVLVPSWLALPVFWVWVLLSVLYVVLPEKAWRWMKVAVGRASANLRRKRTR